MKSSSTAHAILPIKGVSWLCLTHGSEVTPLAQAPGMPDARFVFAPDASALAVLDMDRKRAGLFRILAEEPWFEQVFPFAALPKDCKGHALAVVGGSLLVGGHSKTAEALWIRTPGIGNEWQVVPIPERFRARGKAIDGLLLDGPRVIAVDDLIVPKWVIVYRVESPDELRETEVVALPEHISYERIHIAVLGTRWIGLVSKGTRYGSNGTFISLLDADSFAEQAVWSICAPTGLFDGGTKEGMAPLDRALLESVDLGFVGDTLLVACGPWGLLTADLTGWTPPPQMPPPLVEKLDPLSASREMHEDLSAPTKASGPGPALAFRDAPGLTSVERIVISTPPDPAGAFAVGPGPDGIAAYVWIPRITRI